MSSTTSRFNNFALALASIVLASTWTTLLVSANPRTSDPIPLCDLCSGCRYSLTVTNLGGNDCRVDYNVQCDNGSCATIGAKHVRCGSQDEVELSSCCPGKKIKPTTGTTWDNVTDCTWTTVV